MNRGGVFCFLTPSATFIWIIISDWFVFFFFYKKEWGIFRVPSLLVLDESAFLIPSVLHFKEHDIVEGEK